MKGGDLGSSPSFAVIFEFYIWLIIPTSQSLNCPVYIMRQLNETNLFQSRAYWESNKNSRAISSIL